MDENKPGSSPPGKIIDYASAKLLRGRQDTPKSRRVVPVREFLSELYPDAISTDAQLVLWSMSRKGTKHATDWTTEIEDACTIAKGYRQSKHVYFGVCLQNPHAALNVARQRRPDATLITARGSETSAVIMPALWVDIDCREGKHAQKRLPSRSEAVELLGAVPVEPSALVWSGGGFHAYWIFREPLEMPTEDERKAARDLVARLQGAIARDAQANGWTIDNTADLARVLRLPNTFNHKTSPPQQCTIEHWSSARYNPSDFDALPTLDELGEWPSEVTPPSLPRDRRTRKKQRDEGEPADYRAIMSGCSWLRHCEKDAAYLPEPEWYAALSIVARSRDNDTSGVELGHQLSKSYPGYDPAETERKIRQALTSSSARTCGYIAGKLGAWTPHCQTCAHWDRIKSPIVLGRRRPPGKPAANEKARTNILITTHEKDIADETLQTVIKADSGSERSIYQRFGLLVHVVRDELEEGPENRQTTGKDKNSKKQRAIRRPTGSPTIRDLPAPRLREIISEHCAFARSVRSGSDELRAAHTPDWLVAALIARGEWRDIPRLEAVIEGPVYLADGTILQNPGYHAPSGILYVPNADFEPVPEKPNAEQIKGALTLLDEVVCDFPFESETHKSAWMASVLTPLCRFAFMGPSPLNLIDANVAGAGKSMLADTAALIVSGRPAARMRYSPHEDEMRKAITSLALSGTQTVLIDNLTGRLSSASLDTALTATTWMDRMLGTNRTLEIPLDITWYATGNNVSIGADTYRRSLHIRLESHEEHPERRTDFRHPNLLDWIARNRYRIQSAALTLLRGYFVAGRPDQHLSGWGSYEEWSAIVRGCIVWLGLPDPGITRDELEDVDDSRLLLLRIVRGLEKMIQDKGQSLNAVEILELAEHPQTLYPGFAAVLQELPRVRGGKITPRILGYYLRDQRNRYVEGRRILMTRSGRRGRCWFIDRK